MEIPISVLEEFQAHTKRLTEVYRHRKEAVSFRNVVDDREEREAVQIVDTLGKRQPQDVYDGDVNLRTLRTLLIMIDERGYARFTHHCARFCHS